MFSDLFKDYVCLDSRLRMKDFGIFDLKSGFYAKNYPPWVIFKHLESSFQVNIRILVKRKLDRSNVWENDSREPPLVEPVHPIPDFGLAVWPRLHLECESNNQICSN